MSEFNDKLAEAIQALKEETITTWLGNHTPFRCKRCGHYSDTRTPYCAYCGKKVVNVADP